MQVAYLVLCLALCSIASAQMRSGQDMPGFAETFGVVLDERELAFSATFVRSTAPGNVLWPGEQASFTFQLVSTLDRPIRVTGRLDVVPYGTRGRPGDIWVPDVVPLGEPLSVLIGIDLPPRGYQDLTVTPTIPERFGGYGLVVDLGEHGRRFVTSLVRTFPAEPGRVQFPQLGTDVTDPAVLQRLGCKSIRFGVGYKPTTDPDFETWFAEQARQLRRYWDANVSVIVEFGAGAWYHANQPLGRPRPHLTEGGVLLDTKTDIAWLPSYDRDFRGVARRFAAELGWPRGPVVAMKLWNEPWEGLSISGWGADLPRYREIYTALCEGVEAARRDAGVQVLLGGCDSSSNTFDKLFADGNPAFLDRLDFCSIHYQGMHPPSTVKQWVSRPGPRGRVRIWDTESWVANCDDRVAAVMATNMSTGHDRAVGVYGGNICTEWHSTGREISGRNGERIRIDSSHTWSVAAAVAAAQHFIGERRFRELLFRNGLPWVMIFDGLPREGKPNPEDGTVVVVGDIGDEFGAENLLFRTARGLAELAHEDDLRAQLAALPPSAAEERRALQREIDRHETLRDARMVLRASAARLSLFDFYGNLVPPEGGVVTVPLDHRGFFLRGDGRPGSFAALLAALKAARIEGIEPLETICLDMLAPIEARPTLRLRLTNVLNRPLSGRLSVALGALAIEHPPTLAFRPHQTRLVAVRVVGGEPNPQNAYPLRLTFDAGADGVAVHEETLHCNVISRRTIAVDGSLGDWRGVLPQTVASDEAAQPTLAEAAWFPFVKFEPGAAQGFANGYLAYDEQCFYFAARIADETPDEGTLRFATRDDEEFYYPEVAYEDGPSGRREFRWPEGVRRYSYRKHPVLPAGNAPNFDNVQLAFNVLPPDQKTSYPCPPGTMPGYIGYEDTDYEYALNKVAPRYGGGTEIWRLKVPGMPHKHFYPRQPASPFDGPVTDGRLVTLHEGNTRLVEASLPWTELPAVKQALDAGRTIKFSFRVNDNAGGGCLELSRNRSVAKRNGSFHVDWAEHWANELEFAFER